MNRSARYQVTTTPKASIIADETKGIQAGERDSVQRWYHNHTVSHALSRGSRVGPTPPPFGLRDDQASIRYSGRDVSS